MKSAAFYYLQSRILCGPGQVLFTLLIFILNKELHATPFQLMVFACLKPITSLFSFYVSSLTFDRPHQSVRTYLIANTIIGCAPCLFFPLFDNVWFYIVSYAIYTITMRAKEPIWIEYLKCNLELPQMSKTVSRGASIIYFMSMFLPPVLSFWLDGHIWKSLFFLFALLQLVNAAAIFSLVDGKQTIRFKESKSGISILDPLKKGYQLLKDNRPFCHYLFLFFLGGAGIVAIQPILPIYFNEQLNLSYAQLTLAFSFCKGISFLPSSPIWAKYVTCISLYRLNALMNLLTTFFMAALLAASFGMEWLYVGYLCYGAMQGGSEQSWNMSGPIFSNNKCSTAYSSLNLLLVGIRGCICPFLGYLLFSLLGIIPMLIIVLGICLISVFYGFWLDSKYAQRNNWAEPNLTSI